MRSLGFFFPLSQHACREWKKKFHLRIGIYDDDIINDNQTNSMWQLRRWMWWLGHYLSIWHKHQNDCFKHLPVWSCCCWFSISIHIIIFAFSLCFAWSLFLLLHINVVVVMMEYRNRLFYILFFFHSFSFHIKNYRTASFSAVVSMHNYRWKTNGFCDSSLLHATDISILYVFSTSC